MWSLWLQLSVLDEKLDANLQVAQSKRMKGDKVDEPKKVCLQALSVIESSSAKSDEIPPKTKNAQPKTVKYSISSTVS